MQATPRQSLADRIESIGTPQAKAYAEFIRKGDEGKPIPCWGVLAERIEHDITNDEDRKAVLSALIAEGDARPLLLFMYMFRAQPAVISALLEQVAKLPPIVQRALVSLEAATDKIPRYLDTLEPAARQMFQAGGDVLEQERRQFEMRVFKLMASRYFMPEGTTTQKKSTEFEQKQTITH